MTAVRPPSRRFIAGGAARRVHGRNSFSLDERTRRRGGGGLCCDGIGVWGTTEDEDEDGGRGRRSRRDTLPLSRRKNGASESTINHKSAPPSSARPSSLSISVAVGGGRAPSVTLPKPNPSVRPSVRPSVLPSFLPWSVPWEGR